MFPVNVEFEMCDDFLMISRPPPRKKRNLFNIDCFKMIII